MIHNKLHYRYNWKAGKWDFLGWKVDAIKIPGLGEIRPFPLLGQQRCFICGEVHYGLSCPRSMCTAGPLKCVGITYTNAPHSTGFSDAR